MALTNAVQSYHFHRHRHAFDRPVSRRAALVAGVAATGAALTTTLWVPLAEAAGSGTPKPIPQTLDGTPFHVQGVTPNTELSTITDFNGVVAAADIDGVGIGSTGTGLTFNVDMRFMSGEFIDTTGRHQHGTFGFI
jgi:hypothetical protein